MTAASEPMNLQFEFQRDDYVALATVLATRTSSRQALNLGFYAVLAAMLYVTYGGDISAVPVWLLVLLALALTLTLFHLPIVSLIAHLSYPRSLTARQRMTLHIDNEALTLIMPLKKNRMPWPVFKRVVATPDHLVLVASRREGVVVPRRALPDAAAFQALETRLRQAATSAS